MSNINPRDSVNPYSLLQTVADNKNFYTAQEIKGAENARLLQEKLDGQGTVFTNTLLKKICLLPLKLRLMIYIGQIIFLVRPSPYFKEP